MCEAISFTISLIDQDAQHIRKHHLSPVWVKVHVLIYINVRLIKPDQLETHPGIAEYQQLWFSCGLANLIWLIESAAKYNKIRDIKS
jgi:hypothetical protein